MSEQLWHLLLHVMAICDSMSKPLSQHLYQQPVAPGQTVI